MKFLEDIIDKMNLRSYSNISFDLDGTLIDSLPVMEIAWKETCDRLKLKTPFESYKKHIGLPFKIILTNLNLMSLAEEISQSYFELTQKNIDQIKLFPYADELLNKLSKTEKKVSIITSKPRRNAENIIEKFELNIDVLIAGGDTEFGKPFHDPFDKLKRVQNNDSQDKDFIYFGDTINDLIFSINSNIDYCHCNFGIEGSLSELMVPRVNSINSLSEIII